jgi:enoyl-CoA hydratase/carnithine racemase
MILIDQPSDGVVVVTLNRPEVHNALSTDMQRELDGYLAEFEADRSVRCLVLTGAGDAAFSAGYDIHELAAMGPDEVTLALLQREEWMWRYASLRMPTIAALSGITYGAGALMACALDMRIGCERTTFKVTAGRYAGANATWSLPQLVGLGLAKEILYTSRVVTADEGLRIGLLNRVVPSERLQAEALALAESIAANPPEGIEEVKRLVHAGPGRSLKDRYEAENVAMRTTLKPRPMGDLFAGFLGRDAGAIDGRGTTDNGRPL